MIVALGLGILGAALMVPLVRRMRRPPLEIPVALPPIAALVAVPVPAPAPNIATVIENLPVDRLARQDGLTGLPDRLVFATHLQTAIRHARSEGACSSVLLVDLDGFKKVNDLHGHATGDVVLCEIARRLEKMLRKNDLLARLGGDEFAVIAQGKPERKAHHAAAVQLATRMLATIKLPIAANDASIHMDASIGIALCRGDSNDAGRLLHAADVAMVSAKRSGRGNFGVFDQRMEAAMREEDGLKRDLIQAIAQDAIQPYFQPVVDLRRNRICGFEALARWEHAARGFVAPDVFIPIVERLGLMTEMTTSILGQACRAAKLWPKDVYLAVNFSASELHDPALASRVRAILEAEALLPSRLEIEITETAVVSHVEVAKANMAVLQAAGIVICLDDFGTGYASLAQLRQLKFDKLKIDRSFVQAMQENADCEKIVDAVIGLARSLGLPAVAEGIESAAVLASLVAKGCEFGQGFVFGKAMTGGDALKVLKLGVNRALAA